MKPKDVANWRPAEENSLGRISESECAGQIEAQCGGPAGAYDNPLWLQDTTLRRTTSTPGGIPNAQVDRFHKVRR